MRLPAAHPSPAPKPNIIAVPGLQKPLKGNIGPHPINGIGPQLKNGLGAHIGGGTNTEKWHIIFSPNYPCYIYIKYLRYEKLTLININLHVILSLHIAQIAPKAPSRSIDSMNP